MADDSDSAFDVSGDSATDLLSSAAEAESLGEVMRSGIGGFLLGIAVAMIQTVNSIGDLLADPIGGAASGLEFSVGELFRSPGTVIGGAADATATALQSEWQLGPLTLPVGVAVVLVSFMLIAWYRDQGITSNLIPGIPIDVPIFGADEEE